MLEKTLLLFYNHTITLSDILLILDAMAPFLKRRCPMIKGFYGRL